MAEHEEITEYLKAAFPTAQVPPPSDHATTVAPVFPVIEGDVERQLEICRPIWNDFKEHTCVAYAENESRRRDDARSARQADRA